MINKEKAIRQMITKLGNAIDELKRADETSCDLANHNMFDDRQDFEVLRRITVMKSDIESLIEWLEGEI